jgi:mono/diheme cytochrome c family protein
MTRPARGFAAVFLVALGGVAAAEPERGRVIYEQRCAACHGANGDGNGLAAAAMEPRPKNLRDADFWRGRTAADVRQVVRDGKRGTLMAPFAGALSDADIDAVVAYVESFRPGR